MRWWISVPVWGERYLHLFNRVTLPALEIAIKRLEAAAQQDVRLVVHTDDANDIRAGREVIVLPVPEPDRSFHSMSNAHREVFHLARRHDRVVPLTADMVLSPEGLLTCHEILNQGNRIVCAMGMRCLDTTEPPSGADGRVLMEWGWTHRHPMTIESTWPKGRSMEIWRMYFNNNGNVCCRLQLPHPLAFVVGNGSPRFSPTVDVNLASNFPLEQTYLVTEPSELTLLELSPPDKEFVRTRTMAERLGTGLPSNPVLGRITHPRHRRFFQQRIIIRDAGGDFGDGEVVRSMLGATH